MGLHTGTPLLTEEGYVGADVHRAARIAAAGHGRQVLLSVTTAALVDGEELRDLGEHRLKDLSAPERIFQLGDGDYPPLKTLYRTNLPVPATPFLGRDAELAEVPGAGRAGRRPVADTNGRRGLGKDEAGTAGGRRSGRIVSAGRLVGAARAARDPRRRHAVGGARRGRRRQGLRARRRPATAAPARQFRARRRGRAGGGGATCGLPARRRARYEPRAPASAGRACLPGAGARAVGGEAPVRDAGARSAARVRADDSLDDLCARLDDLPLAIELAAARASLLSTAQLSERLGDRLDLLRGGRDAEKRQQTLRATIEWSYELLEADERKLFAALSVFRAGWTLEAAERVGDADLDLLQSLADKSLVRHWESGRLGMLETIRAFAAERLEESGKEETVTRRHAEFFLDLAESANLCAEPMAQGRSPHYERVLPERENILAALEWLLARDETELAMRLAVSLESFWVTSDPLEGRRWLTEVLERGSDVPPELRVRATRSLGGSIYIVGDFEDGARLIEQSLAEYQRLGDNWGISHMKMRLAVDASRRGDLATARALCEEALESDRSTYNEAQATRALGEIAFQEGRPEEAIALLDRSAELAEEVDFRWWQLGALEQAGEYALTVGRAADALPRLRAGLRIAYEIADRQGICYGLTLLAWSEAVTGAATRAGALWAAVEAEAQRARIGAWEAEREDYKNRILAAAGPGFGAGMAQGRTMTLDDAVAYALVEQT
jgi:tetratricopeptide (TPR) repeat protein